VSKGKRCHQKASCALRAKVVHDLGDWIIGSFRKESKMARSERRSRKRNEKRETLSLLVSTGRLAEFEVPARLTLFDRSQPAILSYRIDITQQTIGDGVLIHRLRGRSLITTLPEPQCIQGFQNKRAEPAAQSHHNAFAVLLMQSLPTSSERATSGQ
jgi:hypothetical protein